MLTTGTSRDDFLAAAVARGEITQATADQTKARFTSSRPFSFDRLMHVRLATDAATGEDHDVAASARAFAVQCGERISLAIANVKLRDELYDQSTRDPLTGLYNRRYFLDAMRRMIAQSDRTDWPFGVVYLDADRFKSFNDTHGHDAGDVVLSRVGEALRYACTDGEMACRFGGEEFALPVPGADLDGTERIAEQIRASVAETDIRYGNTVLAHISISAGVAAFPLFGPQPTRHHQGRRQRALCRQGRRPQLRADGHLALGLPPAVSSAARSTRSSAPQPAE